MGFENYISEPEAATLAGVSNMTLRRFAEAGYFKVESDGDGLTLYPKTEISRLFKINESPLTSPQFTQSGNGHTSASDQPRTKIEINDDDFPLEDLEPNNNSVKTVQTPVETAPIQAVASNSHSESKPETFNESARLKLLLEMHEKLLAHKEGMIQSLQDERDWLRARIEKLEEKSNRDQVLLLAETQTIKTLISIQERRRSPIRAALEWFGFIEPGGDTQQRELSRPSITVADTKTTESAEQLKKAA